MIELFLFINPIGPICYDIFICQIKLDKSSLST